MGFISRMVQLVHDLVEYSMDRAVGAASLVGYINGVTNSTRGTMSCQQEGEESVPDWYQTPITITRHARKNGKITNNTDYVI